MVIEFAKEQVDIIRELAPTHAITHNFMVCFTDFDHHKFNREVGLDIATFDSYPLAGIGAVPLSYSEKAGYIRTGLPDLQSLMHALYHGVSGEAYATHRGPFGVMEQQHGVLNWNQYPSGDLVKYFRWRQVTYAQEQTLAGLFTSDNAEYQGYVESQGFTTNDLPKLHNNSLTTEPQADVVLVFDYGSNWVWAIEPYSGSWSVKDASYTNSALSYTTLFYTFYCALRRLGLSVDIISPEQSLLGYKMVVVPSLPIVQEKIDQAIAAFSGSAVFGPHRGSKTRDFAYAPGLNPAGSSTLRSRLPTRVTRVETPPSYARSDVSYAGEQYNISCWEEWVSCTRNNVTSQVTATYTSRHRPGTPAACSRDNLYNLGFNPTTEFLVSYLGDVAKTAGIKDLLGREASKENDLG